MKEKLQGSDDLADVTLSDIENGWDDDGGEGFEIEKRDLGEREHEGDLSLDYLGLNEDSIGTIIMQLVVV